MFSNYNYSLFLMLLQTFKTNFVKNYRRCMNILLNYNKKSDGNSVVMTTQSTRINFLT